MNNEPLIHLPVYEPAGKDVRLDDEKDLLSHLLIVGATGSGKSTLLHRIMAQLISRPDTGLLIFDAKQDDTVERVQQLARQNHRDCIVLGPQGTHYVNLFQPLRTLDDVDGMVKRLLVGTSDMGHENAFWNEMREALLDAALTLLVVEHTPVTFEAAVSLMSDWFFRPPPRDRVVRLAARIQHALSHASPAEKRKLSQTLDTIVLWNTMESRTRSNVQATLVNASRPLTTLSASKCFEPNGRPAFDVSELVARGGICCVSLNATTEPMAGIFFKLLKQDFVNAVQSRQNVDKVLCGIISDELPLLIGAADVEMLATVRSRRCCVCAATQGLSILDEKLGVRQRKALLANFGTLIFMRGREEETDQYAAVHLGTCVRSFTRRRNPDDGFLLWFEPVKVTRQELVCPPGTLGRLQPHQAFIALPNHQRCESPVWFVPHFEEPAPLFAPPQLVDPATGDRLHRQLCSLGLARRLDAGQLQAAMNLFSNEQGRRVALRAATEFFRSRAVIVPEGLATLPLPWLKSIPSILWSLRQPHWTHLPFMIKEVFVADGVLQFRFAQEAWCDSEDLQVGAFDRVRIAVNTRLYPACYRPLKREHACRLKFAAFELEP